MNDAPRNPCHCSIAPPNLLAKLAEEGADSEQKTAAIRALAASASTRTQRSIIGRLSRELNVDVGTLAALKPAPGLTGEARQSVYDLEHGGRSELPGVLKRRTGDEPAEDVAVNEVFDSTDTTYDFYNQVYQRNSIDGEGLELISSVHYSQNFDNAFWNGAQMIYGDGSGGLFQVGSLTKSIDVIAHELTHGVTQFTAALEYSLQPGALNESFSDVFGSLVKQYSQGQNAEEADWLIGEGILVPSIGKALRSMSEPGTANSQDDQPGHMDDYVNLPDDGDPAHDNGGVHINSGIPNRAFHLAATAIGGYAWEKAGQIWFDTLTGGNLASNASFVQAAEATLQVAAGLYGEEGAEYTAVADAWQAVGVL